MVPGPADRETAPVRPHVIILGGGFGGLYAARALAAALVRITLIDRRNHHAFEAAERETDPARRACLLTFVIVGGGPTGVELAGAIREIAQKTLAGDFRHFDPRATRVLLLDAGDRVLPSFPEDLSRRTREMLEARGVEVRTGALVTA